MKAKKPESHYEPVPKGNHVARLYQIVHIGTIPTNWQGQQKMTDKVRLTFELCNEKKAFREGDEPKPFSVSREFTLSMGAKSNLRPFVEGFIGTKLSDEEAYGFDLEDLLGEACLLNVVHAEVGENVYANINSATPLVKGMEAPALFNEKAVVDVDTATEEEIDALPDFLKEKMRSSEEYAMKQNAIRKMEEAGIDPVTSKPLQRPNILKRPEEDSEEGRFDITPNI
jgi:hypothetical protein